MPWWGLLLGGPLLIVFTSLLTAHFVNSDALLEEAAPTPEMRRAIQLEHDRAAKELGLKIAKYSLEKAQRVVPDSEARAEIEQALVEIEDATREVVGAERAARDADEEAQRAARKATNELRREIARIKKQIKAGKLDSAGRTDIEQAVQQIEQATRKLAQARRMARDTSEEAQRTAQKMTEEARQQLTEAKARIAEVKTKMKASDAAKDGQDMGTASGSGSNKNSKHRGIHIEMGDLAADDSASSAKLGPLPELSPEVKRQIRDDLRYKVYKVGFSIAAIVLSALAFVTLIPVKMAVSINRALKTRAARSQAEANRNKLEKELVEARLAAMQAQIEPHFLFNTLASVQHLIESDPQAATRMQANLITYLRAAVPRMRDSSSTLGQEAELTKAYLSILRIRMGDRLQFDFAIPYELERAPFPPMMIATLAENAIKHGLEPKPEGGRIDVYARAEAGKLRVTVADTGMGFPAAPGSGVGLANIRDRLAALYGKAAVLIIEDNPPHGAKLTIEIPHG